MPARHLSTAIHSILLAALLSGCFEDGGSGPKPTPVLTGPTCIGLACLAEQASDDARYVLEHYGLAQITNDSSREDALAMNGDWVVWTLDRGNGSDADPLYAYNFASEQLIAIVNDLDHKASRPHIDKGRMVFLNEGFDGSYALVLWDSFTNRTEQLDTGLDGAQFPSSFDDEWIVFLNRFSSNETENAWWAWNIKDDRLVYLYKPLPENRRPDGSYETLTFTAVDDGVAYYPLTFADTTSKHFNATFVAVDLTTGERREYSLQGNSLYRLSVNDGFAVSDPGGDIVALNLTNGTFWKINAADELSCANPTTARGLVSYTCGKIPGGDNEFKAVLVNLTSGQRTRLFLQNLPIFEAATDGSTWLLEASRGAHRPDDIYRVAEVYDYYYTDLYWMKVPT